MYVINEIGHKDKILDLEIPQVPVNLRKYIKIGKKKIPLKRKPKRKVLGYARLSADLMLSMNAIDNLKGQALFGKQKAWERMGLGLVGNGFPTRRIRDGKFVQHF